MRIRIVVLTLFVGVSAFIAAPALLHGQARPAEQHDQHHSEAATPAAQSGDRQAAMMAMMARMKAAELKLNALVEKMNAAKGPEKVDAIAALLNALVQDHRAMHESMMANMPEMTNMMGGKGGPGEATTPTPK